MLIDRIYLRNYRVFEDELDLVLPPGLVGVYGPNGAGKSTLLESVLWALWGQARTKKEEVPSAGTRGECVAEVSFEHEGHIYLVRRTITGANATVRAEAHCDGLAMAESVRDTGRYVHSVLGMDDRAFRASVFAEQKQLAAFSDQGPADRRKLVLSLLGVTPLDAARDKARADARRTVEQHDRLRAMLPDLENVKVVAADAEAEACALEVQADEEERAAAAASDVARDAREAFGRLDLVHQEHERLVLQGKAARSTLEAARRQVDELNAELSDLGSVEARLRELEPLAERRLEAEQVAPLLRGVMQASKALAALVLADEPAPPDEEGLAVTEEAAMAARSALGTAEGHHQAAIAHLERARRAHEQTTGLSGQEDCPLCGQPLGDAFAQVQSHRAAEVAQAEAAVQSAAANLAQASLQAKKALQHLRQLSAQADLARKAHVAWRQAATRRSDALQRLGSALASLAEVSPAAASRLGPEPSLPELATLLEKSDADLKASRSAAAEADRLRGRLERRTAAQKALEQAEARAAEAASQMESLRSKVVGLGFDQVTLDKARAALSNAEAAAAQAASVATSSRQAAIRARAGADAEAKRLAEARSQHSQLADLANQSVHLARAAELLNAFRNDVVATVGPRLAVQAADLFSELTDNDYDRLEVDPETYGLKISDAGLSYGLERFSGSEVDLANLALRVAISEHVRLLSGGTVGLLVLDEVFGPLDEERKARMLQALERLRARFRQILVVTHSSDIKDQLPHAIEVVKRPGRRATARVVVM